ncbi:MAG TPA: hypothetical protein PKY05_03275 [Fibrobacteria bacterium]|nr:hypothetical protein [Fibrobacteria bacterium]
MSLDPQRIAAAALQTMEQAGFEPTTVPYKETGKSATQIMLEAIAAAVVQEIKDHAVVEVKLVSGLAAWMATGISVPTDGGASLKTSLMSQGDAFDQSRGTIS